MQTLRVHAKVLCWTCTPKNGGMGPDLHRQRDRAEQEAPTAEAAGWGSGEGAQRAYNKTAGKKLSGQQNV